jgi:glutathione S-transferase
MAQRAPNPRRVALFLAEKGVADIPMEMVNLNQGDHRTGAFLAKSPLAKVPALELTDGRVLTETRAICTYFEGLYPEPNLMGDGFEERAFIEMADRRIELYLMVGFGQAIRHTHPGLAVLEQPQFPDFGQSQAEKATAVARWLDGVLTEQPYVAGQRFTIADITAFCALEFARGLLKFVPGEHGMPHLQAYRDRWMQRDCAKVM